MIPARELEDPAGSLADALGDVVWRWSLRAGRLVYLGPAAPAVIGRPISELLADPGPWSVALHPEDRERVAERMRAALAEGCTEVEYRVVRPDGEVRWLLDRARRVDAPGGEVLLEGIARDITARREGEERMARKRELLQAVVGAVSEGLAVVDRRARFDVYSRQIVDILGYSQADCEGPGLFTRLFPVTAARRRARAAFSRAWAGDDLDNAEYQVLRKDGEPRDVLLSTRLLGTGDGLRMLVALRDVTEQRRAEHERAAAAARLREAERHESLALMAGGVAHDFNNLLQSILGFAELAGQTLSEGTAPHAAIEQVLHAGRRAAELTRQMLAFSGRARRDSERVDLSALVSACRAELAELAPPGCAFEAWVADAVPPVDADPTQLRQVLRNLVENAFEALGDGRGRVFVSTGTVACDRDKLARCHAGDDLPEGTYSFVQVADDGCGMPEAVRHRLFDPFFSTKFTGRGLGLAAALGIVRSHRGAIEVESRVGRGTSVRVLLPVA